MKPGYERANGKKYAGAVISVLFDSRRETRQEFYDEEVKVINDMFDSLLWNVTDKNPKVEKDQMIKVGTFMSMLDLSNRWIYDGSFTTPPCKGPVYWNIPRVVYPIERKHLDQFQKQLARNTTYDLANIGNFREVQPMTMKHNLLMIEDYDERKDKAIIALAILLGIFFVLFVITTCLCIRYKRQAQKPGPSFTELAANQTTMTTKKVTDDPITTSNNL